MSALLLLFLVHCCCGEFIQKLIGDSLSLDFTGKCTGEGSLVHVLYNGSRQVVAALVSGQWKPKTGYEDRLAPGREAVVLEYAVFNDKGKYELSCKNMPRTVRTEVEVLAPFEVRADLGQSIKLQSHFQTLGRSVRSVRWERGTEEELVYKQDFESGEEVFGQAFDGRVQMSPDPLKTGDMSLTLSSVQPQDLGVFYCKVQLKEDWENGHPAAVQLWLDKQRSFLPSLFHWVLTICGCIVSFIVAFAVGWFCQKKTNPPRAGVANPSDRDQETKI